jgi:hypothetical protein
MTKHRLVVLRVLAVVVFLVGLALTIIPGTIASTVNAPFSPTAKPPSNLIWVEPVSSTSASTINASASSNSATSTTSVVTSLSDTQRTEATTLLARDPTLHQLLGSNTYTIAAIGPWTTTDSTVLLGAAVNLQLSKPLDLSGPWPYTTSASNSPPYYSTGTATYSATNVTEIDARVVLSSEKVVSLQPWGPAISIKTS